MKLQKLLDEYKYNKKDQESIKKDIIRLVHFRDFRLANLNPIEVPYIVV